MILSDPAFDTANSEARDALLLDAMRKQIGFVRRSVPYWAARLSEAGVNEADLKELSDLARLPILSKAEFRAVPPASLVPVATAREISVGRWTSGTSGRPTVNFWSATDWAALVAATSQMLRRHAPMQAPTVFNVYSQAHVTGPLYGAALRALEGVVFDRSHHGEDLFSTQDQMALFEFDTLVIPAKSTRGKGIGLADLQASDPGFLARMGIRWWIGSSGTFDPATMALAQAQGVQTVTNLYGSSEFALFAASCPGTEGDYHISQGHVLVEVVDDDGCPVKSGQFGRIVVSHLRGMDGTGEACDHTGTQILRLAAGDGATLLKGDCACGLSTPRLRGVRRLSDTG